MSGEIRRDGWPMSNAQLETSIEALDKIAANEEQDDFRFWYYALGNALRELQHRRDGAIVNGVINGRPVTIQGRKSDQEGV